MDNERKDKYIRWLVDHLLDAAKDFLRANWKAVGVVVGIGALAGGAIYVSSAPVEDCDCIPVTSCIEKCLDIDADLP